MIPFPPKPGSSGASLPVVSMAVNGWAWLQRQGKPLLRAALALLAINSVSAFTFDDIQMWTGSGTNRAAMVVHWTSPEVRNNSSVPAPVVDKSLAWGFRWNGAASGEDMFNAILAADPRLTAVVSGTTAYGKAVFGLGYDLNNNRVLGLRDGTRILAALSLTNAPSAFTNGLVTMSYGDTDGFQPLDATDLYWGGWYGPNWELWHESGAAGGFTNAPDRGPSLSWTPNDPAMPWSGNHGEWHYAEAGMSSLVLKDGSWMGWSVSAGGLDFANPDDPGTIAWMRHKHAPAVPEPAPEVASPYAVTLTESAGAFGPSLYGDPNCVVGQPSTLMLNSDPIVGKSPYHIKIVEPAYNRDIDGNKVIVTLSRQSTNGGYAYGYVTIAFDHPVTDHPANPYGIDFQVFGNAFYVGSDYVSDVSDMRTYNLVGGIFAEPMLVSVSPDNVQWYTYTNGPFCDDAFPTQGFEWDPALHDTTGSGWTMKQSDFTKPVNPVLNTVLGAPGVTLPTYSALKLYAGSGGGTGFDLAESGFSSIRYVRVSAGPGYYAGEVDAVSDVRPTVLGESLCIAPANLLISSAFSFQEPGNSATNAVQLEFNKVADIALATVSRVQDKSVLAALPGTKLEALDLRVVGAIETNEVAFDAAVVINVAPHYEGGGGDLDALTWDGANWTRIPFEFATDERTVRVGSVGASGSFAVVQITPPRLSITTGSGGVGFQFNPVAGWRHALERTVDFQSWSVITSVTPKDAQPQNLKDSSAPPEPAFYRLRLDRP